MTRSGGNPRKKNKKSIAQGEKNRAAGQLGLGLEILDLKKGAGGGGGLNINFWATWVGISGDPKGRARLKPDGLKTR